MGVLAVVGIVLGTLFTLGALCIGAFFVAYIYAEGFKH